MNAFFGDEVYYDLEERNYIIPDAAAGQEEERSGKQRGKPPSGYGLRMKSIGYKGLWFEGKLNGTDHCGGITIRVPCHDVAGGGEDG